jgi:anti-sigma factor RsiW
MRNEESNGQELREVAWRRELTPEEAGQLARWLADHRDEASLWEEEQALTRLLTRLPEEGAPSNFTARVLAAVDRAEAEPERVSSWLSWLGSLGWTPRLAGVALLVVAGYYFGHHQFQNAQRAALARNVAEVSGLAQAVPSVEALLDLKYIRNLSPTPGPDEDLLAMLQ